MSLKKWPEVVVSEESMFFLGLLLFVICTSDAEPEVDWRLSFHRSASPLAPSSKAVDWPRFNGPHDDAWAAESNLQLKWGDQGPPLLWEVRKGEGYSSPVIKGETLVLFHRFEGKEIIEGRRTDTGSLIWSHEYEVDYRDRYGYLNGPRASPVIVGQRVYSLGVTAWLTCLELQTGKLVWKRNLGEEFAIPRNFFGKGSNPLAVAGVLVINVGGGDNQSVIGLDLLNGSTKWVTRDEWGASYSSPRAALIQNREVCLVFAGGESRPSTGGLLVIDPVSGEKISRFAWRSKSYESVNAVPPTPLGGNRVFLSECYEKGAVVLSFDQNFNPTVEWENADLNLHWMTPVVVGNYLYGISGRHQRGARLFCVSHANGRIHWREPVSWDQEVNGKTLRLELFRGSILKVGVEGNEFLALSELGSLLSLSLDPGGWSVISSKQLFFSSGAWTLPALSHGLLYVMQNEADRSTGALPRMLCFDLRKNLALR